MAQEQFISTPTTQSLASMRVSERNSWSVYSNANYLKEIKKYTYLIDSALIAASSLFLCPLLFVEDAENRKCPVICQGDIHRIIFLMITVIFDSQCLCNSDTSQLAYINSGQETVQQDFLRSGCSVNLRFGLRFSERFTESAYKKWVSDQFTFNKLLFMRLH